MSAKNDKDFYERLSEELDMMPKLGYDMKDASTDELVRGMIKMLTGNGNPLHGYMAKVASIHLKVGDIENILEHQTERCDRVMQLSGLDRDGKPIPGLTPTGSQCANRSAMSATQQLRLDVPDMQNHNQTGNTTVTVNTAPIPVVTKVEQFSMSAMLEFAATNWKSLTVIIASAIMVLTSMFNTQTTRKQQQELADRLETALSHMATSAPSQPKDVNGNHTRPDISK